MKHRKPPRLFAVMRPDGEIVPYTVRWYAKDARRAALDVLTGAGSGETWKDIRKRGNRIVPVRVTISS